MTGMDLGRDGHDGYTVDALDTDDRQVTTDERQTMVDGQTYFLNGLSTSSCLYTH